MRLEAPESKIQDLSDDELERQAIEVLTRAIEAEEAC